MSRYRSLIGQFQQDLTDLERIVERASTQVQRAQQTGDDNYLDAVALNLHTFYTATERIFEEIAREIDSFVPAGSDWHRRILRQMLAEMPEVRPPVITQQTYEILDEYRAFRHIVRNIYTFELRPTRIQELAANLPVAYRLLVSEIQAFCDFLGKLASATIQPPDVIEQQPDS